MHKCVIAVFVVLVEVAVFVKVECCDILEAYFASENKTTEYTSIDDLYTFEALKAVVEDMTALMLSGKRLKRDTNSILKKNTNVFLLK